MVGGLLAHRRPAWTRWPVSWQPRGCGIRGRRVAGAPPHRFVHAL